jgi:hypothetical protein
MVIDRRFFAPPILVCVAVCLLNREAQSLVLYVPFFGSWIVDDVCRWVVGNDAIDQIARSSVLELMRHPRLLASLCRPHEAIRTHLERDKPPTGRHARERGNWSHQVVALLAQRRKDVRHLQRRHL